MKYLGSFIFALLMINSPSGYAAFMLTGDQEMYYFTSSDFSQIPSTYNNGVSFGFNFADSYDIGGLDDPHLYNGHLEPGEILRVDFYENQGDSAPFETHMLYGQDPAISGQVFVWFDFLNDGSVFMPWLDHEGSIVFTSMAGEMELSSPSLIFYDAGTQFSANLSVTAVPLPPSLSLLMASFISLLLMQRKKSQQ